MSLNAYVGLPYRDGIDDCYGLVRRFYRGEYGLHLRNYARPVGFDHGGLELLRDNFEREGFEIVNVALPLLEPGDGLLFMVGSRSINHVGVITQPGRFLHHLYRKASSHDNLDPRWQQRLSLVVRHPDVQAINKQRLGSQSLLDLIPPHLRPRVI